MALAILDLEETTGGEARFRIDIGHNRYFRYQIGDHAVVGGSGAGRLAYPVLESELNGPLRDSALGRTSIEIPLDRFGRRNRFVQLLSYREPPDIGIALSEIVEVREDQLNLPFEPGAESPDEESRWKGERRNAPRQTERTMQQTLRTPINAQAFTLSNGSALSWIAMNQHPGAYAVPFSYREAPYSDAFFLQALIPMISSALPVVNQVISGLGGVDGIGKLLGGLFGGSAPNAGTPPTPNPSGANPQSLSPELAAQIVELIKTLAAPQTAAPPAKAKSLSTGGYSQQMIAPALLAVLPALMPLVEKAMNPQTINAVLSNVGPKATIGAVTDAVKDIGGLNIQAYQNILDHIQKNMPSSDTTPLLNHLLAVSESLSKPSILPSYRRIESVQIGFPPQTPVMLSGREQIVYLAASPAGVAFPLTLETPRPIRSAQLFLIVKHAETLEVVAERDWLLSNVTSGPLPEIPRLTAGEMAGIRSGGDYLVCTYLIWKTTRGETIGSSRSQLVHFAGALTFQGVESGGDLVALNDVDKFRGFWHKVWQGSFSRETKRWEWECKYYYALQNARGESERMETVTEETPEGGRRIVGRMKSGIRVSLAELNALLPQISSKPALDATQLEALASERALAAFARAARTNVEFRGDEGESAALWIYPEMRIQPIVLLRAGEPNAHGLVSELTEEVVYFPAPASVHFVGVSTQSASNFAPELELEGLLP